MATSTTKSVFLKGLRDGAPFLLVALPFALLFGVVATEAGLNLLQVMAFSVLVIAGASQFTAVTLMAENAPTIIVLATALAVNLRMMMYSAAMVPHLGPAPLIKRAFAAYFLIDQSYAVSYEEFENNPTLTQSQKLWYFAGSMTLLTPAWYLFTYIGAVVGSAIPPEYALDFALPITFLAMIAPAMRTLAHVAAVLTSIVMALLLVSFPAGSGLLVAAISAMIVGAQVEVWMTRKTEAKQ